MPESTPRPTLLISACLLGHPVRYDGQGKPQPDDTLAALRRVFDLVPVCPESLGGLPTPRPPAEIVGGSGKDVLFGAATVREDTGGDVTAAFLDGARQVLALARQYGCRHALLKSLSPSCGNGQVYDGSFAGVLRDGEGVAAALLGEAGIRVWGEGQVGELLRLHAPTNDDADR